MASVRVLVVDDHPAILKMVSTVLAEEYEVLSSSSPRKALEILENEPCRIDLVISDIEMSEMAGQELLAKVCRISPTTAGLLMSGSEQAIAKIPDGTPVLKKPFTSNELFATVDLVLARSEQLQANLANRLQRTRVLVGRAQQLKSELGEVISRSAEICSESRRIHSYAIVQDGYNYGIAVNGDVKVHGLKLEKAQKLVSILNSIEK